MKVDKISINRYTSELRVGVIQTSLDYLTAWSGGPKMSQAEEERAIKEINHFMVALREENPRADVILLPELAVPRGYLRKLKTIAQAMESIVIAGVDYKHDRPSGEKFVSNEAIAIIPNQWRKARISQKVTTVNIGKTYPSEGEVRLLEKSGHRFRRVPEVWLFDGGAIGIFGVAICYDFLDLERLALYRLEIQHLFVLAYNKDISSFDHAAEAMARMIFCNVVVCNCGYYGGSIAVSPFRKPEIRTVYRHGGNKLASAQLIKLPVKGLIAHRHNILIGPKESEPTFKALPPGHDTYEALHVTSAVTS